MKVFLYQVFWYSIWCLERVSKTADESSNLQSFLLRGTTRPYELGIQWDSNSLVKVSKSRLLTEAMKAIKYIQMPKKQCLCFRWVQKNTQHTESINIHLNLMGCITISSSIPMPFVFAELELFEEMILTIKLCTHAKLNCLKWNILFA